MSIATPMRALSSVVLFAPPAIATLLSVWCRRTDDVTYATAAACGMLLVVATSLWCHLGGTELARRVDMASSASLAVAFVGASALMRRPEMPLVGSLAATAGIAYVIGPKGSPGFAADAWHVAAVHLPIAIGFWCVFWMDRDHPYAARVLQMPTDALASAARSASVLESANQYVLRM